MTMKRFKFFMVIAMAGLAMWSCEIPPYPSGNEGTVEGLGGARRPPDLADYESSGVVNDLTVPMPEDFIRGVDISNCYIIEQAGGLYYDDDNTPRDIIEILSSHGVNWVRLRLWHNHKLAQNPGPYEGDGDNDLLKTKAIARRAKAAGMKFLLNFHYSDNWADPGRQQIPAAWSGYTEDQLVQAIYDYTFDTILELKAAGAEPDMVQLGNEITPGLLSPTIGNNWANVARVLNSGAQAVRLAAPDAKIMLHLDKGGAISVYRTWFDRFAVHNSTPATTAEVDFDVVGLSWYPYYSSHSSIDNLDANIRDIQSRYGKEVVVAETGWAWTIAYDGDELSNLFHRNQENQTAVQMTDNNGYVTASGISFATRDNGTKYLAASPENQAKLLRAVMDATATAGGSGVFWWAGDWIPAPGLRSNWDNQTLFDFNGKALPALSVLGGLASTAGTAPPLPPGSFRSTASTIDSVTLAWNASYSADGYALYRATVAEGPWDADALISDAITETTYTYTDTNLTPGTTYYYQLKAHNEHGWGEASGVTVQTGALTAPANFRISDYNDTSISLAWAAVTSATAYKIYHVESASEPDDDDYTQLGSDIAVTDNSYDHTGLGSGTTHYYKISAVFGSHGEGPRSSAVHETTGAPPPPAYATVDMTSGTLDADFSDSEKASASTQSLTPSEITNVNDDIQGLYVANDATNLYIALTFSAIPSGLHNARITVMLDNTSLAGSTEYQTANPWDKSAATTVTVNNPAPSGSLDAYIYQIMQEPIAGAASSASWTQAGGGGNDRYYQPAEGTRAVKYAIPLSNIGNAGNVIRVFATFSRYQWYSSANHVQVRDMIPSGAGTVSTGALADNTLVIDMSQALSYTIK